MNEKYTQTYFVHLQSDIKRRDRKCAISPLTEYFHHQHATVFIEPVLPSTKKSPGHQIH